MSVDEENRGSEGRYEDIDDDRAHQGCYLYTPQTTDEQVQRPSKRRKTRHSSEESEVTIGLFPPLLNGHENAQHAKRRQIAFRECWKEQQSHIEDLLEPEDDTLLDDVVQFVKESPTYDDEGRLWTGLVACGPNSRWQTRLLHQWKSTQSEKEDVIVVDVDSAKTPNLMTAVKNIIRAAVIQLDGVEGYQTFLDSHKRKIHMNYDLELLQELVAARCVQKCVVYLTDIETFDNGLLADLLSLLSAWRDRIPFVLLLGISTTVDLFEARLPNSIIQLLECVPFEISEKLDPSSQLNQLFQGHSNTMAPSLGPVASSALVDMSREEDLTAASLRRAIKYATMSHFFANSLSIFLDPGSVDTKSSRELCEAIRSTDSFRAFAERKLDDGDAQAARNLLNDDKALLHTAKEAVKDGQEAISRHQAASTLFAVILGSINPSDVPIDSSSIHVQTLSGPSFLESATYTELIARLPILPSNQMRNLLNAIQERHIRSDLDLAALMKNLNGAAPSTLKAPLRSAYDPTHTTTSTTIKNNKVSLSRHGPKLSAKEAEYTRVVDEIADTLSSYFESNICNPTDLFMHEAFVYDAKSPLAAVFTPRPRYTTERALSAPHDYLSCDCCEGQASGQLSASQPPTSILWQLWCEAGGIVNVRDLWNAFAAIVVERKEGEGVEEEGKEEEGGGVQANGDAAPVSRTLDERMALALFYRGLAELKMMGFVKGTKRKVDCLAKTAWRGL